MDSRFVHLRLHTEYSIVDGLISIHSLLKEVVTKGMNAVAVSDYCNLFAAVKFYKAALNKGIKPILGSELPCIHPHFPATVSSLILLCQNEIGYRNLTRLISKAYIEGQVLGQPQVHYDWLASHAEGLIALSGAKQGFIGKALLKQDLALAFEMARHFAQIFPQCFYLEIQRTDRAEEDFYNEQVLALAVELKLPIVATNDVCFLHPNDFEAHETRVCIHESMSVANSRRKLNYSPKQYLRSAAEMVELFQDMPAAIKNSIEISKRCTLNLDLGHNYLPQFPLPEELSTEAYLSQLAVKGLEERFAKYFSNHSTYNRELYEQRLNTELNVINSMGFASYFLIVADFIQWAKQNGIPVGPGRGSGAGSLVAYVLHITDLDPLQYELLFERFLNPERVSMPDFDIDFCMEGRDRVIEYVAKKYGRENVSQIITFGRMAAKAVVRDVGRALGHPYGFVDKIAKLIPFELGITLNKALAEEIQLKKRYDEEEEVKELIDLALKLEGITRNAGKHAGGLVIAPSPLTDYTAIYCEQDSTQWVSQFDKDDVESVGLVKFDFLGLRTLTIIDWALKIINARRREKSEAEIDISLIPMNDKQTFELLKNCQTTAVFQLESRGMKDLIHRLQPDCFEEIIALVALFRPGPLQSGMVDDFINRKHGRAPVVYPHSDLEPILKPTYGVILYQEQVMQIAQVLANYTLGAADLLRRAMGKKKAEEMAKQRESFIQGAAARGVSEIIASSIFDLMEKFAGYGFNKSHSAAYALVSYQTAWLKAHFPADFMAAVLSSDMDNTDKVVIFMEECARQGLKVLPPQINESEFCFTVKSEKILLYGLGAIKGVGQTAIECMVAERKKAGNFKNLFDFCERVDLRKVNRRTLEALIKSGAFDEWGVHRASLYASLEKALKIAEQNHYQDSTGQALLFEFFEENPVPDYVAVAEWTETQRLEGERESLGLYFSGHPTRQYSLEFRALVQPIGKLTHSLNHKHYVCGLIMSKKRIMTKKGKPLVILGLEDFSGRLDVVIFSEILEQIAFPFEVGQILVVEGEIGQDDYTGGIRLTASQLLSLAEARARFAKHVQLEISLQNKEILAAIKSLLQSYPGQCPLQICYKTFATKVDLVLDQPWKINPDEELLGQLRNLLGQDKVYMIYE